MRGMRTQFGLLALLSWHLACEPGTRHDGVDAGPASDAAPDETAHDARADDARDAALPLGAPCDPRSPACAQGEKCTSTRWDLSVAWPEPRCVPDQAEQGQAQNEACFAATGIADGCASGLSCTNFGSGEGFCRMMCSTGEACGDQDVCAPVDERTGFALCLPRCSENDECPSRYLRCVERAGVKFCDAALASP